MCEMVWAAMLPGEGGASIGGHGSEPKVQRVGLGTKLRKQPQPMVLVHVIILLTYTMTLHIKKKLMFLFCFVFHQPSQPVRFPSTVSLKFLSLSLFLAVCCCCCCCCCYFHTHHGKKYTKHTRIRTCVSYTRVPPQVSPLELILGAASSALLQLTQNGKALVEPIFKLFIHLTTRHFLQTCDLLVNTRGIQGFGLTDKANLFFGATFVRGLDAAQRGTRGLQYVILHVVITLGTQLAAHGHGSLLFVRLAQHASILVVVADSRPPTSARVGALAATRAAVA